MNPDIAENVNLPRNDAQAFVSKIFTTVSLLEEHNSTFLIEQCSQRSRLLPQGNLYKVIKL